MSRHTTDEKVMWNMAKRPDLRALISLLAVLTLVLALALGAGCTSDDDESADTDSEAATEEEAVEDEAVEDEAEADDAGTADEGMSEGEQLVQERCTGCHDLTRVEAADYDQAGWEANVDRMIQNGASLTPEERDVVVEYLAAGN
jgi:cytochrome c5